MRQHFFSKHDNRTSFDKVSARGEAPRRELSREGVRVREGLPAGLGHSELWFPLPDNVQVSQATAVLGPHSEWRQGFRHKPGITGQAEL